MFASIFIPMLTGTLHLAVNNFDMYLPKRISKASENSMLRKCLITALLFLLAPLDFVFLETLYLQTTEEARELARCYNIEVVKKKLESRKIRMQMVNFAWIELGIKFFIFFCSNPQYSRHGGVCPGDCSSAYSVASKNRDSHNWGVGNCI